MSINKREGVRLKHYNDCRAFTENSIDMEDIYENIEEYNPNKECKILTIFNMIADMLSNIKLQQIITDYLLEVEKTSLIFITHIILFCYTKKYSTKFYALLYYENSKQKRALTNRTFNHSSDIDSEDFMNLYKKFTAKPCSFLVNDTTLNQHYLLEKLINMNILQVKKYYILIKVERQNKLSLLILL